MIRSNGEKSEILGASHHEKTLVPLLAAAPSSATRPNALSITGGGLNLVKIGSGTW